MADLAAYSTTLAAVASMAVLLLVQVLVADVLGIRRRHIPGTPVAGDHADALFRATRTVANSNETIAVFLLGVLACVLGGADPGTTAAAAWAYVALRIAYALAYWSNLQTLRSILFGLSLLALAALPVNFLLA